MIASVRGRVAALGPDGAVVEVGGVGLAVPCTPGTLAGLRVGEEARLATSLIVREDSLTLYGFADDDERSLFELLQTASGVGPRLAQAVLAVHTPDAVRKAIATGDIADADPGAGHRQEGRRAAGAGAARPDRPGRGRRDGAAGVVTAGGAVARPGPAGAGRAGLDAPARPTRRSPRSAARSTAARAGGAGAAQAAPSSCSAAR